MLRSPRPYGDFPLPLGQSGCISRVRMTPDIDKSEQKNRTVPPFSGQSVRVSCGGVIVSFKRAKQDPVPRLGGALPARLPAPQIQLAFPALIPPVSPTCPGGIRLSEDEQLHNSWKVQWREKCLKPLSSRHSPHCEPLPGEEEVGRCALRWFG